MSPHLINFIIRIHHDTTTYCSDVAGLGNYEIDSIIKKLLICLARDHS